MKIRLFLDEDSMGHALAVSLRTHGIDVQTAFEAQTVGDSDERQLEFAAGQGRVLCTFNIRDFNNLHGQFQRSNRPHAGIILVAQQRYSVGEQLRRILNLVARRSAESMLNQAEFLSAWEPE